MKYNRFIILRRLIGKNKEIDIEIPIKYIIILGFLSIVSTAVSLVSPYLYSLLIDKVMIQGNLSLLYTIIPAMVGVFVVGTLLALMSTVISVKFFNRMNLTVKTRLFDKLMKKELVDVIGIDVGKQQKLIEQDSMVIGSFLMNQIKNFCCAFIFVVVYFVLMLMINKWLTFISLIFIPIAILCSQYTGRKFNKYQNELWEIGSKNTAFLFDTIQKWREIKVQKLEEVLTDKYNNYLYPEQKVNLKWMRYYALDGMFYAFKNSFIQSLLLYFIGGLLIIKGEITIGSLLMFISYISGFSSNVDTIISSITGFESNKAVFDRLFHALESQEKDKKYSCPSKSDIEIKDLSFSYDKTLPSVLENVSYKFEYGKKYLIVGKSGGGKSTLIKLILSMVCPINGEIKFGGVSLEEIQQQSLFEKIGIIMQESSFFNLTIKENLRILNPNASDEEIVQACEMAQISEFIQSLPESYDTVIGERGIKLSGGQKQRLAIARMILHRPEIAIIDEATSSLDTVSETKILANLNALFHGKTLIVISHKPALQVDFNEKIVIHHHTLIGG